MQATLSEVPSLKVIAERSGVAYGTVYRVFEGRWPRQSTAEKLARGLGLPVGEFIRRLQAGRYKGLAQRFVDWEIWKPVPRAGAVKEADGSVEMEMKCKLCGAKFPNVAGQLLGHQKSHVMNGKREARNVERAKKRVVKRAAVRRRKRN